MTTRERNLAIVAATVFGVGGIAFIGYQFVISPLQEKNKQIAAKTAEIDQLNNDIYDIEISKRKYESARQQSLPADPVAGAGVAREEYERLLIGLCRRADLTNLKSVTNDPDSKSAPMIAPKKPAYTKLTWDLTARGDEYHLVEFMRLFYSQPLLHTIKSITVQRPSDARSRATRELDISLKVEALVLDNAQVRPTLLPMVREIALLSGPAAYTGYNFAVVQNGRGAPIPPAGVLADPPREYLAIAGKNAFFGPTRAPPTTGKGPEDDISQFVVLTSIVIDHDDGTTKADFWDKYNNNYYTITQSATGAIAVKGEYLLGEKRKLLSGYSEKNPGRDLLYGTEDGDNLRVWRVRRVTAREVILEKVDKRDPDGEPLAPPAIAFLGGGGAAFVDVPEGKMYSVSVGACLETTPPKNKDVIQPPPPTPYLLRREAFKAIFAPIPDVSAVSSTVEDRQR